MVEAVEQPKAKARRSRAKSQEKLKLIINMTLKKLVEKLIAKGASVEEILVVERTYMNKQAKLRSDFVKALLSDTN